MAGRSPGRRTGPVRSRRRTVPSRRGRSGSLPRIAVDDPTLRALNLKDHDAFRAALSALTGSAVTNVCLRPTAESSECRVCANCVGRSLIERLTPPWTRGKLNQALVFGGQRTMSEAFHASFFPARASNRELLAGISQFRAYAMLRFGGFRVAYEELSRMDTEGDIIDALSEFARPPAMLRRELRTHQHGQDQAEPRAIALTERWYLGYISDRLLVNEFMMEEALRWRAAGSPQPPSHATDRHRRDPVAATRYADRVQTLYDDLRPGQIRRWRARLDEKRAELEALDARRTEVIRAAERHSAAYLAASHIDVYIATSMRESWEFEAMGSVVPEIFGHRALAPYRLTYFDPTLSYYESRFDKSLLEGLMINRAKATIYMVQETDTLGKDSELASTLAYGKPVIAYVPTYNAATLTKELERAPLRRTFSRMFMLLADGTLPVISTVAATGMRLATGFRPTFVLDIAEEREFRARHRAELDTLYEAVALAEINSLNRRADSLIGSHPLALQLRHANGVACGVLVARTPAECARLLAQVVTNDLKLQIDEEAVATVLREVSRPTSRAAFRVVTRDPVLTNAFWTYWRSGRDAGTHHVH